MDSIDQYREPFILSTLDKPRHEDSPESGSLLKRIDSSRSQIEQSLNFTLHNPAAHVGFEEIPAKVDEFSIVGRKPVFTHTRQQLQRISTLEATLQRFELPLDYVDAIGGTACVNCPLAVRLVENAIAWAEEPTEEREQLIKEEYGAVKTCIDHNENSDEETNGCIGEVVLSEVALKTSHDSANDAQRLRHELASSAKQPDILIKSGFIRRLFGAPQYRKLQ